MSGSGPTRRAADGSATGRSPARARTAIPQPAHDGLARAIEDGRAALPRGPAGTRTVEDPCVAFAEWGGAADRAAYADL